MVEKTILKPSLDPSRKISVGISSKPNCLKRPGSGEKRNENAVSLRENNFGAISFQIATCSGLGCLSYPATTTLPIGVLTSEALQTFALGK